MNGFDLISAVVDRVLFNIDIIYYKDRNKKQTKKALGSFN